MAEATKVATSDRRRVGEGCFSSGCRRLVSRMTKVSDAGSTQRLVPVKPVWPKPASPKSLPLGELKPVLTSQPRALRWPGRGVAWVEEAGDGFGLEDAACRWGLRRLLSSIWA